MSRTSSLVFCALLVSSFGHDALNRHQPSRLSRTHQERWSSGNESSLKLLVNSTNNLVAVVNNTSPPVAKVVDVNSNFVGLFDGLTGNVVLVDLASKCGLFIAGNCSHVGWFAKSQTFDEYFKSLSSLKSLYECNEKNGEKFTDKNVSQGILYLIKTDVIAISGTEYYFIQDFVLDNLISYTSIMVQALKGPLNGVLKLLPCSMSIGVTSMGVISIFEYLGKIVCNIPGGVSVLEKLNLDWKCIFNPKSTTANFIYIFSKLCEQHVDIKSIARHYTDDFSVVVAGLAGNSTKENTGALGVLAEIRGNIVKISGVESLVHKLLQYYTHIGSSCATFDDFVKELKKMRDFLKKTGLDSVLPNPIAFVQGLEKGSFKDNGVDVYQISRILFDTKTAPLQNIIRILILAKHAVSLKESVAELLYRLILLVVDRHVDEIRTLVPSIKIDCSVDFLVYVFRGAKVSDLRNNLYEFLRCRPVIGQILEVIDSSLKGCNAESLQEIINSQCFCKYECLIIKLLERVINEVNEECGSEGGGGNRHLKSRHYGASKRHFEGENKQLLAHAGKHHAKTEKHHEHGKHHKERHGHEKYHKERHGHARQHKERHGHE